MFIKNDIISNTGNYYTIKEYKSIPLPSNLEQEDLKDRQFEVVKLLLSRSCGLLSAYTGFGKSYIMCYLIKYLPKPIMITAPIYSILQEFTERLNKRGISYSFDLTKDSDVYLVNPVGIANRNLFKDGSYDKKLSEIKSIMVDECMSIPFSLQSLIDKLTNLEMRIGMSATPDKLKGSNLMDPPDFKLNDLTCEILHNFGLAVNDDRLEKNINIHITSMPLGQSKITYSQCEYEGEDGKKHIDENKRTIMSRIVNRNILKSHLIPKYLHYCYDLVKSTILFPYQSKNDVLPLLGISDLRLGIWNSGGLFLNSDEHFKNPEAYDELKKRIKDNTIDYLFVSTIGKIGVDFPSLKNIMLFNYSGYGTVIQAVGRCTRTDEDITVFLPKNTLKNEIFNTQFNARLNNISKLKNTKIIEDKLE